MIQAAPAGGERLRRGRRGQHGGRLTCALGSSAASPRSPSPAPSPPGSCSRAGRVTRPAPHPTRPSRRSWRRSSSATSQRTESFDGTTGHGQARTRSLLAGSGTLTALPAAGDVIDQGTVVAEVDGRPIIALQGPLPMWRALGPSVDDGKDVLQLEYVLAALGYADTYGVTVDEDWTSATTNAVEAFQEDHGQDDDGTIDVGDIVWIPGARPRRQRRRHGRPAGRRRRHRGHRHRPRPSTSSSTSPTPTSLAVGTRGRPSSCRPARRSTAWWRRVGTAETAEDGSSTLPVDVTLSGATTVADGAARRRRGHHRGGRRRPRRPGRGTARAGRGRLRRRGRPTAATADPPGRASSSACSPTTSSRSPATSRPATRWWCRERATGARAERRHQALPRPRRRCGRSTASTSR